MKREIYEGLVMQEQSERFNDFLNKYPELERLFGPETLKSIDSVGQSSKEAHPLFWHINRQDRVFAEALIRLAEESPNASRFITELINTTEYGTSLGLVREVQAYHLLRSRGHTVVWKPPTDSDRGPDMLIQGSPPIYLEVFSITESQAVIQERRAQDVITAEINKLQQPYSVTVVYRVPVDDISVTHVLNYLKAILPSVNGNPNGDSRSLMKGGRELMEFVFYPSTDGIGYVAAHIGPGGFINTGGRAKGKLLDKIDKFQLPLHAEDGHINGYLIFLDDIYGRHESITMAVFGQYTITFPLPGTAGEAFTGHAKNGIVHDSRWNAVGPHIDFIASVKTNTEKLLSEDNIQLLMSKSAEQHERYIRKSLFDC